jgi:hypothetical protein
MAKSRASGPQVVRARFSPLDLDQPLSRCNRLTFFFNFLGFQGKSQVLYELKLFLNVF